MRGEDMMSDLTIDLYAGSPPHAWGRQHHMMSDLTIDRFTPTCVGKTSTINRIPAPLTVHPHMRGEDWTYPSQILERLGSPPHAWGRPVEKA